MGVATAATFTWPSDFAASTSLDTAIGSSVSAGDTMLVEAGSYTWDATTTYPSVRLSGGLEGAPDDVTILAKDGPGTVVFQHRAAAFADTWIDLFLTNLPTGWVVDGITLESDVPFGQLLRTDDLVGWTFRRMEFRAGDEAVGAFINNTIGPAHNLTFEDCTFTNGGGTTGNLMRMTAVSSGWTFERCTFDLSTMGTVNGATLVDITSVKDFTFRDCTFIGPSSIGGTVFGWVIGESGGNLSGNVDFVECSFRSPTSATGASWVALKFTDGSDSCDVIGSDFVSSLPASVNANAVKYEDATSGEGFIASGRVIGSSFTNYRIGILFGERAYSCVAIGNRIIGQNGSDDDGIYFQDARYCVATNNWIERCGRSALRFSAGDECQSGGFCNFGNAAVGNYVNNSEYGVYVFTNGGVSAADATTDSASVRAGNVFEDVNTYARVGSSIYYANNWSGYVVDSQYGGLLNGLASVRADSTEAMDGLIETGALPGGGGGNVVGVTGAGIE